MENLPDAPDIAHTLRTGYPYKAEDNWVRCCPRCNEDMTAIMYTIGKETVCEECFKFWAMDYLDTNPEEVANALYVDTEDNDG